MTKNMWTLIMSGLLLLAAGCSSPYYIVSDFDERTADNHTIAVLPFEVIFTGTMPKDMTQEHMDNIQEAESKAFQISLYNQILASTKGGKKPFRIDFQSYDKTTGILKDNNISIRESWNTDPQKLAEILGVDAVVKAHVEKARFMSDLASYGIEVGTDLINWLSNYHAADWIPGGMTISKEVKTSYALIDKNNGTTLWSIHYDIESDWREKANAIIDHINHKAAKYFPYRENK